MRTSVRRGLSAFAIAGGFVFLGVATADAATADPAPPAAGAGKTSGDDGVVSGNQSGVEVTAPVETSGNQVTVVGDGNQSPGRSGSKESGGTTARAGTTSGEDGTGSGNQTGVQVEAPIDASGNQVTVIGDDNRSGGSRSSGTGDARDGSSGAETSGRDGVASGNQSAVSVCAPVDASGNQVTVIGDGNRSAGSEGSASCDGHRGGNPSTSGEDGVGSGNQTGVDATTPVEVSGNQVTVIGDGNESGGASGSEGRSGSGAGSAETSGEDGVGSGNQTGVDATTPVEVSGNQVTVIGDGNESGGASGSSGAGSSGAGSPETSGEDGVGSGNQTGIDAGGPVEVSGNQVTVVGDGNESGGASGPSGPAGSSGGSPETSGEDGVGSGNQTGVGVGGPVEASDNQVTIIGDDNRSRARGDDDPDEAEEGPQPDDANEPGEGDGDGNDGADAGQGQDPAEVAGVQAAKGGAGVEPVLARAPYLAQLPTAVAAGLGTPADGKPTPHPVLPLSLTLLGLALLVAAGRRRSAG
ncbi:chaplin family protein [Nocardioides coralli]|uniref:chaplin family protein n=1 Tax=Nocardioides coralli TaxID=2872154 RepID=UPI001CA45DEC|nr:chaplin family protein [Nocardioides coralli]QZY28385.1 DUF320 domain-containing protein [Nocardioides coralli]